MSGGGTAGHIHPALSVAETLVAEHDRVTFFGTPNGLEARLVPDAGIPFRGLSSRGFDRARPWTLVAAVWVALVSGVKAWSWLGSERPDVVIGFGGYVSVPVGLAAVARRIPLVLHEQNSVPGLANRILSRWATAVAVTYEESIALLSRPERAVLTGNPVSSGVLSADAARGRADLGVPGDATMLLVFGGSRGARHLNTALVALRERLLALPDLFIVHVTGPTELEAVSDALADIPSEERSRWLLHGYWPRMGDAIAGADLVVCRAGATTLAELTALGAPAVIVPYPYATDDHQTKNAAALVAHDAALLVSDERLDEPSFGDALVSLLQDGTMRATMAAASRKLGRTDAAQRVASLSRTAARGSAHSDHSTGTP